MKIALSIQKKKERKQLKKTASQGLLIDEQLERVLSGLDDSEKEFMKGLGYDFLAQMAEDGLMSNQRGNEQANAIVEDQVHIWLSTLSLIIDISKNQKINDFYHESESS